MQYILPIACTLFGLVATLFLVTMLLAGGANSTPQQIAAIKAWMFTTLGVGALGVIGAVWLMILRRPMPAAVAGGAPFVFCVAASIYLWFATSK